LTRDKIWRPAWFRIRDMWGDVAPDTITFEMMSKWRAALEKKHGRGVAHKTLRGWRTFWKIMLGMRIARTAESMGIRNRAPAPRWQRWSEGETVRLVKTAWRHGYHGLACVIAVAWDTQFSPVDVRTLSSRHRATVAGRLVFDRQTDGRTKTGRAAIGTLSARTEWCCACPRLHWRQTSTDGHATIRCDRGDCRRCGAAWTGSKACELNRAL
jgi:hypothetical protein